MSAINQVAPLQEVTSAPEVKEVKETPVYKRTVDVAGYDVPYWVVALVVVAVVVVIACYYTGKCTKQKVKLVNTGLTSIAAPTASASSVTSVGSEQVRAQLRDLFEQF